MPNLKKIKINYIHCPKLNRKRPKLICKKLNCRWFSNNQCLCK